MAIDDVVNQSQNKGFFRRTIDATVGIGKTIVGYKAVRVVAKALAMGIGGYIFHSAALASGYSDYAAYGWGFAGVGTGYLTAKIIASLPTHIAEGLSIIKKIYNAFVGEPKPSMQTAPAYA